MSSRLESLILGEIATLAPQDMAVASAAAVIGDPFSADLATKRGLAQTLKGIVDEDGELGEERVRPLVRGFCGAGTSTAIRPAPEPGMAR